MKGEGAIKAAPHVGDVWRRDPVMQQPVLCCCWRGHSLISMGSLGPQGGQVKIAIILPSRVSSSVE